MCCIVLFCISQDECAVVGAEMRRLQALKHPKPSITLGSANCEESERMTNAHATHAIDQR